MLSFNRRQAAIEFLVMRSQSERLAATRLLGSRSLRERQSAPKARTKEEFRQSLDFITSL